MDLQLIQFALKSEKDASTHSHYHEINRLFKESVQTHNKSTLQNKNVLSSWFLKIKNKISGVSPIKSEKSLKLEWRQ